MILLHECDKEQFSPLWYLKMIEVQSPTTTMSNMKCLINHVHFHFNVFYKEEHFLLDQHMDSDHLGHSNAVHQDDLVMKCVIPIGLVDKHLGYQPQDEPDCQKMKAVVIQIVKAAEPSLAYVAYLPVLVLSEMQETFRSFSFLLPTCLPVFHHFFPLAARCIPAIFGPSATLLPFEF